MCGPAIGTRLGPYGITAKLGEGGMGEVWRATDSRLDRDVALKVLPGDFATDSERHARFEREAKVLASLDHPNIATLYDLQDKEICYLASGSKLMSVPVTAATTFNDGSPASLFEVRLQPIQLRNRWVASRDGQRFLFLEPEGTSGPLPMTVVLHWAEALKPR